ncbi:baseplate J/gp47 family protein [Fluviicola sp.]|uniref:baseplate J/gp47 family protein n=1 Tax=Fluviicola sp. TaxID=1917219 RepID=UPI003D2C6761
MSNCNDIAEVLKRNGLDQSMRYDRSLDPENIKLMGFGLEDWMKFTYNFAKNVNYFDESNDVDPNGNWQDFFPDSAEIKTLIDQLEDDNKLTPHLTLFVCFLTLINQSTNRLNGFTKRHLDFYYSEVLQLNHLNEEPDRVNIIFELARTFSQEKITAGTELNGEKDSTDVTRVYLLEDEMVLNQTKIASVKSVYNAPDSPVNNSYGVKAASNASSYDGAGAKFPGDDTSWYPFGYAGTPDNRPEQATARLGFAVASHTLELSEGKRQIVVQAQFSGSPVTLTNASNPSFISVYYTGAKGWVGPIPLSTNPIAINENNGAIQNYAIGFNGQLATLCVELQPEQEAVVNYDQTIHGENYRTEHPVFRFEVATEDLGGYDIYRFLSKPISQLRLKVNVLNMRALTIESDTGTLNVKKPFYPFTTNPVKGSAFSVFHPEVFSKKWKHLDVTIHWKNTPDNFKSYYEGYDKAFLGTVTQESFNNIIPLIKNTSTNARSAGNATAVEQTVYKFVNFVDYYTNIVNGSSYFKADSWIFSNGSWKIPVQNNLDLFVTDGGTPVEYKTNFGISNSSFTENTSGPVRLTLDQSFLQEIYPRIYSLAMMSTNPNVPIPNQPYIPFADTISLSYSATDELNLTLNTEQDFNNRSLQLFHIHPFGEAEENPFLKGLYDGQSTDCTLTPEYCKGGSLFIGMENAEVLQQVSLLIQVLEGSENPLGESFSGAQKVHWSILCNNQWKKLDSTLMLINQTDNFLQSGLVKFKIPVEASSDNTLLPPGMFWIRAKMHKNYDAVCRVLGIFSQAATAIFDNRGNELSHLEKGLPAETITKLVSRIAAVKSVSQPYNSFGGKPKETDSLYYKRISERLRHKSRAINLWDYEHLVLQNFSEIYKVKCLTHTCDCSFQSPGNVTLVVIPDTLQRNVFDPYQPRVSKATLNRIESFISELNSLHVKTHVINPDYEEIRVSLKVKFYPQFDEALYIDQLNEDITRFLSPWAFAERETINFGGKLYLSVLIDYIEELSYVDYLQDVQLFQNGIASTVAEPSSPKAILSSAKRHDISTAIYSCSTPNTATEQCQL